MLTSVLYNIEIGSEKALKLFLPKGLENKEFTKFLRLISEDKIEEISSLLQDSVLNLE